MSDTVLPSVVDADAWQRQLDEGHWKLLTP
jgi:hypothetical protein